jgi:hypothetical protein
VVRIEGFAEMCRQLANEELENWDEVYRNEDLSACRVGTLPNDGSYLCMPYLKPISIHQRLEQKEHVKKAWKGLLNLDTNTMSFGGAILDFNMIQKSKCLFFRALLVQPEVSLPVV